MLRGEHADGGREGAHREAPDPGGGATEAKKDHLIRVVLLLCTHL